MKIEIHDVEHGQRAMICCPNGHKVMIDAGGYVSLTSTLNGVIDNLIITNLDEDHVSGLPNLLKWGRIGSIWVNPTITKAQLFTLKSHGMGNGIRFLYENWEYISPQFSMVSWKIHSWQQLVGDVLFTFFANPYGAFDDTNNLSLAVFVTYGNFTTLFPGDLEEKGWENLLKSLYFRVMLLRVSILVASHHGRENGFCSNVFRYCNPDLVIISDKKKMYETQETTSSYYNYCKGRFVDGEKRYVLSTRKDGDININVPFVGGYYITTNAPYDNQGVLTGQRGSGLPAHIKGLLTPMPYQF